MSATAEMQKTETGPSVYDVFAHGNHEGVEPLNLTIGNPHLRPPQAYFDALQKVVSEVSVAEGNAHGYVTRRDPFGLCRRIAASLNDRFGSAFTAEDILITVGATGALDIILKVLLEEGVAAGQDEVVVIAPYFVEYGNLIRGNRGRMVVARSSVKFDLDCEAIDQAISAGTRAILINSPNNPTGRVYRAEVLKQLAEVLRRHNRGRELPIVVIEDAVYDSIVFDGNEAASMLTLYPYLIRVNSFSKSMSLAGERLGYLAVHPRLEGNAGHGALLDALNLAMRMRVVHAPLLQHRVMATLPMTGLVDVECYRRNILHLYTTLSECGFGVAPPQGTFYLWAMVPQRFGSEEQFRSLAQQGDQPLLYLPGALFGGDSFERCLRLSGCVSFDIVCKASARIRSICRS